MLEEKRSSSTRLRWSRAGVRSAASRGAGHGRGQVEGTWASTRKPKKESFWIELKAFENQDVYFDYDSYTLTEPAKKVLDEKIAFLKRFPKVAGDCRRPLRRAGDDRVQHRAGGKARECGTAVHSEFGLFEPEAYHCQLRQGTACCNRT